MQLADFWYVVAESDALPAGKVVGRRILDRHLVCFRDATGTARVFEDRCLHRAAPLSCGRVIEGELVCAYHGWRYDGSGQVVHVPSLGPEQDKLGRRKTRSFATCEQQGLVYVRLSEAPEVAVEPFSLPMHGEPGYRTLRLQNRFQAAVTDCAENFVDIPHTAFVHEGIFRTTRAQPVAATVVRSGGSVVVDYRGERTNLGVFSALLNPSGGEIVHRDAFHMPNVTSVEYRMGPARHFFITSQSVPESDGVTLVYTVLTWNYGPWTALSAPLVRWHAQRIIDQDLIVLANQQSNLARFGRDFSNTPADIVHVFIESIRDALSRGEDPRALPERSEEITFWV